MGQFPSYLPRYRHFKSLNFSKKFNIGTINTKLQEFIKLGELFKIKYRLVLRPASYEI